MKAIIFLAVAFVLLFVLPNEIVIERNPGEEEE